MVPGTRPFISPSQWGRKSYCKATLVNHSEKAGYHQLTQEKEGSRGPPPHPPAPY